MEILLTYPTLFVKHGVSYEMFPEAWEIFYDALLSEEREISAQHTFHVLLSFDKADFKGEQNWNRICGLIEAVEDVQEVNLETMIDVRNLVVKRFPEDSKLIK